MAQVGERLGITADTALRRHTYWKGQPGPVTWDKLKLTSRPKRNR